MKYTLPIIAVAIVAIGFFSYMNQTSKDMEADQAATNDSYVETSVEKDMDAKDDMQELDTEKGVLVGGAMMVPNKDIVDNAVNSADHTTVVAAVQAADLVDTLKSEGPFTVFAPTNAAFEKLPEGTVDTLLLPENKDQLTAVLTYHVVPGAMTADMLTDGKTLTTVQGQTLTVMKDGSTTYIIDANGGKSLVEIADVISSNGVTHVVESVLLPKTN